VIRPWAEWRGVLLHCAICSSVVATACDGGNVEQASRGVGGPAAAAAVKASGAAVKVSEGLTFKDDDFVESERNRDPFRSYAASFSKRGPEAAAETQRSVIMPNTGVEEMKLIAVISGLSRPKAMLTDQHNVGYVVQRGDYIGRPKVFQTTGSVAMTLNWRVDRIRDNEVVLTRQDPGDPGRPPLSRIISMRDELAAR
jgi:type IV pilus assembly protein PilP